MSTSDSARTESPNSCDNPQAEQDQIPKLTEEQQKAEIKNFEGSKKLKIYQKITEDSKIERGQLQALSEEEKKEQKTAATDANEISITEDAREEQADYDENIPSSSNTQHMPNKPYWEQNNDLLKKKLEEKKSNPSNNKPRFPQTQTQQDIDSLPVIPSSSSKKQHKQDSETEKNNDDPPVPIFDKMPKPSTATESSTGENNQVSIQMSEQSSTSHGSHNNKVRPLGQPQAQPAATCNICKICRRILNFCFHC